MTDTAISPLRQRLIDDMTLRAFHKSKRPYISYSTWRLIVYIGSMPSAFLVQIKF